MSEDKLLSMSLEDMNSIANKTTNHVEGQKKSKSVSNRSKLMKDYWKSSKGKARRLKMKSDNL